MKGRSRPRVFKNRVLRRIFGPKKDEVREVRKDYSMRIFMISALCQV
jgi:hypothetical protein